MDTVTVAVADEGDLSALLLQTGIDGAPAWVARVSRHCAVALSRGHWAQLRALHTALSSGICAGLRAWWRGDARVTRVLDVPPRVAALLRGVPAPPGDAVIQGSSR